MAARLLRDSVRRACDRAALPPAVVLGTNVTGLTEARALERHRIPVIGIDERKYRYASYASAWTDIVLTPAFESEALIVLLLRLSEEFSRPAALFISTDEQVKLIARLGTDSLTRAYAFEFPTPETVECLMSKEAFTTMARERGWPIPLTIAVDNREALFDEIRALRYPVILKPRLKTLASRENAVQKAYRCSDEASLRHAYDAIGRWEPEVVVQEWIPGTDSDVHYSFHYFAKDMREIAWFEGRKIRQWIPEVGSTASSEPLHPPVVTSVSREILRYNRCVGFCSVEYKRDSRTGTYYITEPTVGRVNLQLGTAIANGADLVSRAYFHLQHLEYPGREKRTYDRKWVLLSADIRSARYYIARGELTWGAWLRSLRGPKAFAVWQWRDLRMAWRAAQELVTRFPRTLRRWVRRPPAPPQ